MITEKGYWRTPLFETEKKWDLNYSNILTKLIQYAGRYCESYASDLFIIWKYCVEKRLEDPELESYSVTFGFRDMGVDHDISTDTESIRVVRHLKENNYYYRKVTKLEIKIDGKTIEMTLN